MKHASIWMVQRYHSLGFPLEAGSGALALGHVVGEHFDRDKTVEPRVAGLAHLAHAARAQGRHYFLGTQFVAGV